MRKVSVAGMLRILGSFTLAGALAGCGDAGDGGEEPQGSLARPGFGETAARVAKTPQAKRHGYEVVIIDPAQVTHDPTAINDRGQITSSARNDEDVRQAWFWDGEQGHFLVGDRPDGAGLATDVNRRGQVVGSTLFLREYSEMPGSFQFRTRAFLYDGAILTDFGVLDGNSQSRAEGINQHGDVVGSSFGGTGEQHAVLYQDGGIIDLGLGRALAINKRRQVVGATIVGDTTRAFLYSDGQLQVLGTLGGESSVAVDINDGGDIVGDSLTATGLSRAFLHSDGAMVELPVPGETSTAAAINRRGQVVGVASSLAPPAFVDAYLYQDGQVSLLRDLLPQDGCWTRLDARDINDHGDIVGVGVMSSDSICGEVGRYLIVVTQHPQRYR